MNRRRSTLHSAHLLLGLSLFVAALTLLIEFAQGLVEGALLTSALPFVTGPLALALFLREATWAAQHRQTQARAHWAPLGLLWTGLFLTSFGLWCCAKAYADERALLNPLTLGGGEHLTGIITLGLGLLTALAGLRALSGGRVEQLLPAAAIGALALPWESLLRQNDAELQRLGADIAVSLLRLIGYELNYWNHFTFYSERFYLIVNETCSGVNLLLMISAYALALGQLLRRSLRAQGWLLFWSWPLAFLFNGLRIAVLFLLGHHGDRALAMGPWHTWSAYLLMLPLFFLLYRLAQHLDRRTASVSRA